MAVMFVVIGSVRALSLGLSAFVLIACTQAAAPAADLAAPEDWSQLPGALASATLSSDGLGPIRIGASVSEALNAFPGRFEGGEAHENNPGCREYGLIAVPTGQVALLVFDDVVHRISIYAETDVRTAEGVSWGSTAAEARAAYPEAERESAEYTPAPGHELFVWTNREEHVGLRFEIGEDERVAAIHAGSDLRNIEGCATA